jgi:hypothetical protein
MKTKYRGTHNIDHTIILACSALVDKNIIRKIFNVVEICILELLDQKLIKTTKKSLFEKSKVHSDKN